ncbi:MAG: bifunctional diguanylate cyclase/phosphodiesterase [Oxalobacteraceae bacterium]
MITGDVIFRMLSPVLYASTLLYAGYVLPWQQVSQAYAQLGAAVMLALLLGLAVRRLLSDAPPHFTRKRSLIEYGIALVAVIAVTWPQARMAFPWLVMMVCLFPLILNGYPMLGVVATISLSGLALNLFSGTPASDFFSQFVVTLLAGALAILLSEVLRIYQVATHKAHINQTRFNAIARVTHISHRKAYEIHLKYQALHDPLTGLANRRYMLQSIAESIDLFHATQQKFTVLFCDLDFFKYVNDVHGHEFGDKCLREIALRLRAQLDASDFAARFGSDEFVVLVKAPLAEAAAKAQALLQALSVPLVIDNVVVKVGVSIGIARMRADHHSPSDLMHDADAAMYQAKERGRNRIEIFDALLNDISTRRAQLDAALHFALERNEFSILYQPKVSMQDRSLKGLELLLRWNSPQYGEISPNEFIPIAESNGLIIPIGLWVLEQACRQQRQWQTTFPQATNVIVAVNVSMRQLLHTAFLPTVRQILEESRVVPESIELELTETSIMASPLQVIENLVTLKRLGLRLALDDFGTGYSSLAYLQKLPINTLKIDKAFVKGITKRKSEKEIVRLIIALARTLALDIVAEGVETQEQVAALAQLGCKIGQGFLFSPPIDVSEVETWLAVQKDRRTEPRLNISG